MEVLSSPPGPSAGTLPAGVPPELLPVLVHIQADLDGDLSLDHLAETAGLSSFHFHRRFRASVGETLKQYTQRLRLERAAVRLVLYRATILDIALECGFQSHETFSRAFRRHFGVTPRQYREAGREGGEKRADSDGAPKRGRLEPPEGCYRLSKTRVRRFDGLHLAFLRHIGPYETVDDGLWAKLTAWLADRGLPADLLLGIAHDPPGITPPDKMRFDAAVRVPEPFEPAPLESGSQEPEGGGAIGYQLLPEGDFAVTSHAGHYETLPEAYREIFRRLGELEGYRIVGLPSVEIFHTTRVDASHDLNHTDICIPVERLRA